ncbi:Pyridine nucleotide-disulfide oxidoreductase [Candidatus Nitrososphaera evergladensis SR1]|uniref:Pyridine nucleotide-disulfide oxidoreductase n=1 Tax=Candidatus Nitrososphaera evergladensis SR1 TaxID=1459636 RepID=A0A075MTQ4_9ARCH|nr:electron transfer flavoprotein [Candidatus Nitrososphaera evergladensis]AIF84523.1 Pyridine nucleotide-disulfide oxidoreductase [Candidatus Nitrososphaera evergladensis SR1]
MTERYDVAVIGGGSAGLAALKKLADLGRQAVLIEAGRQVGTKNVSGGILYSKKPRHGKVHNVEDVYGNFSEAPVERKITKYILHAVSKDKDFAIDLTAAHEYQANFGYSVLLGRLNAWFAKQAAEAAEKAGGGIVSGVHVRSIGWGDEGRAVIETDELEPFEVKAVIAADGVNSEIAVMTGARPKFSPAQLYQGVKVIAKLPEQVLEERFGMGPDEGAAHLFAGDVTLGHIGGGFAYTNRDTLSIGAVYHFDSLMDKPAEPSALVDALLRNPLVSEFVRDEVAVKQEIDRNLPKEEQLRVRFAVSKLVKTWNELRDAYYSPSARKKLVESGKYKSDDEIRSRLESIKNDLQSKYGAKFETDYVELEYSAKLVPDGKRCMMKKPYHKNILFVGDAAGRGVFIGPRIEGLNVGIDDAVRAAESIVRAIDRNNFAPEYMGEYYSQQVEASPYTRDMREIDKDYLKTFLDATKDVPKDIVGQRYGMIFRLISSSAFRGLAVGLANMLGYDKLLPLVESEETYVQVPIEIAERLGKQVTASYTPTIPSVAERVASLKYDDDRQSHIKVTKPESEFMKKMVTLCPTKCYSLEDGKVVLQHEACIECGTCAKETEWRHPRGEKGIVYQYG